MEKLLALIMTMVETGRAETAAQYLRVYWGTSLAKFIEARDTYFTDRQYGRLNDPYVTQRTAMRKFVDNLANVTENVIERTSVGNVNLAQLREMTGHLNMMRAERMVEDWHDREVWMTNLAEAERVRHEEEFKATDFTADLDEVTPD